MNFFFSFKRCTKCKYTTITMCYRHMYHKCSNQCTWCLNGLFHEKDDERFHVESVSNQATIKSFIAYQFYGYQFQVLSCLSYLIFNKWVHFRRKGT